MLIHQGWFTALYTQHLLDSQSFEFEICKLQALNMPLIRCTDVFFQGRLSRHITYPLRDPHLWEDSTVVPSLGMGKATPFWQLSSSHRCHQRKRTAVSSHSTALYTQHLLDSQSFEFEICILQALIMPLIRCTDVFFQGRLSRHISYSRLLIYL